MIARRRRAASTLSATADSRRLRARRIVAGAVRPVTAGTRSRRHGAVAAETYAAAAATRRRAPEDRRAAVAVRRAGARRVGVREERVVVVGVTLPLAKVLERQHLRVGQVVLEPRIAAQVRLDHLVGRVVGRRSTAIERVATIQSVDIVDERVVQEEDRIAGGAAELAHVTADEHVRLAVLALEALVEWRRQRSEGGAARHAVGVRVVEERTLVLLIALARRPPATQQVAAEIVNAVTKRASPAGAEDAVHAAAYRSVDVAEVLVGPERRVGRVVQGPLEAPVDVTQADRRIDLL